MPFPDLYEMRLPSILLIGQGAVQTGFSRVLESLGKELSGKYNVHHLALQYNGAVLKPNEKYTIYPNDPGDGFGVTRLPGLLREVQPDIVLVLHDLWYFSLLSESINAPQKRPRVITYSAIDNRMVSLQDFHGLGFVDEYVVFTEFARTVIESAVKEEKGKKGDFRFPPVHVIPHGVDTGSFYPLDIENPMNSRKMARSILLPGMPDAEEAFIVLNANRNQPRKRLDITIQGFAQFAKNKPGNVYLWLHTGLKDVGVDITRLVREFDIADRVLYTSRELYHPSSDDAELNLVYNACDAGVNTSTAEGWGLVSFEHAATGAAQIVPDHTANTELWNDRAVMLRPIAVETNTDMCFERYEVSATHLAEALELLYSNPGYREKVSRACFENATQRKYSWNNIAAQFDMLFSAVSAQ